MKWKREKRKINGSNNDKKADSSRIYMHGNNNNAHVLLFALSASDIQTQNSVFYTL